MKKSSLLFTLLLTCVLLLSTNVNAQKFAQPDKSPMDVSAFPGSYKNANKQIKIAYSRPQLKGRALETLAPNDKVWRTGANEAPELTLYKSMKFGDVTIAPGTYSFYVIPGKKEWTAIINSDLNTWGAYTYDETKDIARIKVPVTKAKEALEYFSIAFNKNNNDVVMHLGWNKTRVAVPFTKITKK